MLDEYDMESKVYLKPYTRAQPYMVGILLGYILYRTKGKEFKIHWVNPKNILVCNC